MPNRNDIIDIIGKEFLVSNIENNEFSYQKALNKVSNGRFNDNKIKNTSGKNYYTHIDLRFEDKKSKISILVETKQNFYNDIEGAMEQLDAYVTYEEILTNNMIISILVNTNDDRIKVFKGHPSDKSLINSETKLKSFIAYKELFMPKKINNREEVMKNTYELNSLLHQSGINERLRGQFVGTCLLAIKNNLQYKNLKTSMVCAGIRDILTNLLEKNLNKSEKLSILDKKILDSQDIKSLKDDVFQNILDFIKEKIYPYINEKSTKGQDLLNLFFTAFNKYVGKSDKNQAFTPDHIVSFMCKVVGINQQSKVLDPCCGSGSFLVRALTDALEKSENEQEKEKIKIENIYGIEYDDTAFGLSTTNMLIHGDGNSNIYKGNCFDMLGDIAIWNIDRVLMNPPYNATRKYMPKSYTDTWKENTKEDPSKGFYYVYEIAQTVKKGKLAVLLPMQCAIGTSSEIKKFKELMLRDHQLDAVFSLPPDMFHPGASANACCMVFNLGIKHNDISTKETFFGYFKDDGFIKKKNLGRVEKQPNIWNEIMSQWLYLYINRKEQLGLSVLKNVSYSDEWLAEAYMETNYSLLTSLDFENTVKRYMAFKMLSQDNLNE